MQNYPHKFFKTRANYYLYKLMDNHIPKGTPWRDIKKDIPPLIGIFVIGEEMMELDSTVTVTAECNLSTGKVFWDRMRKYFISLPHVEVELHEKPSIKELWFNFFKNLDNMQTIDEKLLVNADEGLLRLVRKANVATLSDEEYLQYEAAMKAYMDEGAAEAYGFNRGLKQGIEKGITKGIKKGIDLGIEKGIVKAHRNIVMSMKERGYSVEEIAKMLNFPIDDIRSLME